MAMVEDIALLMERKEVECAEKYSNATPPGAVFCSFFWDSLLCWPPTLPGEIVLRPCPSFRTGQESTSGKWYLFVGTCSGGVWFAGRILHFNPHTYCIHLHPSLLTRENGTYSWAPVAVASVLLVGSFISILTLTASIFIFLYFRCLRCSPSLRVHVQLFAALFLQGILMSSAAAPTFFSPYTQSEWMCLCSLFLQMYSGLSCTNWMFIEGLHLHSRLTSRVFQKEVPLAAYLTLGWGIPFICAGVWFFLMSRLQSISTLNRCWSGYGRSPLIWIITGPMLAALVVNSLFLIDIIRILISKRMAINRTTSEAQQLRKAVKATALLFPLLGIPYLLFCINPGGDGAWEEVYMFANATLKSTQGFFVSILYCFMNTEVQVALKKAYMRSMSRRRCTRSGTSRQTSSGSYITSQFDTKKTAATAL